MKLQRIATQVTLKAKLGYMLIHTLGYTGLHLVTDTQDCVYSVLNCASALNI